MVPTNKSFARLRKANGVLKAKSGIKSATKQKTSFANSFNLTSITDYQRRMHSNILGFRPQKNQVNITESR